MAGPASPPPTPQRGRRRIALMLGGVAAFVAALVVVLVVLQNRTPAPIDREALVGPPKPEIYRFDFDSIVKVQLRGPEREPFTVELVDEVWRTSHAYDIPVNPNRIYDLQATFGSIYAERVIEASPTDLGLYGLDPPQVVGVATRDDGTSNELWLGAKTPAGNTWYLMKPGDPAVYAVWINHGMHLLYTIDDVRQDDLPAVRSDQLAYIYLRKADGEVLEVVPITVGDPKYWDLLGTRAVVQPYSGPRGVNPDALQALMPQLGGVSIDRVVSDDPTAAAVYGLAPAQAELRIIDTEGAERHLHFGDTQDDEVFFQVAGRPTIYATQSSRVAFLQQNPFAIIDRLLLLVLVTSVESVGVRHPGGQHQLSIAHPAEGSDAETQFVFDGVALEEKTGRALYRNLIGVTADSPPDPVRAAAALRRPAEIFISFSMNRFPDRAELRLIPYDTQFYISSRDGQGSFLVDRAKVASLLAVLADPATAT